LREIVVVVPESPTGPANVALEETANVVAETLLILYYNIGISLL